MLAHEMQNAECKMQNWEIRSIYAVMNRVCRRSGVQSATAKPALSAELTPDGVTIIANVRYEMSAGTAR